MTFNNKTENLKYTILFYTDFFFHFMRDPKILSELNANLVVMIIISHGAKIKCFQIKQFRT